jgi:chitinase
MPINEYYATEHILELQMVPIFLDQMNEEFGNTFPNFRPNADPNTKQTFCAAIKQLWQGVRQDNRFAIDGVTRDPIDHIMPVYSSNDNTHVNEFVLLEKGVNTAKEGVSLVFSSDAYSILA